MRLRTVLIAVAGFVLALGAPALAQSSSSSSGGSSSAGGSSTNGGSSSSSTQISTSGDSNIGVVQGSVSGGSTASGSSSSSGGGSSSSSSGSSSGGSSVGGQSIGVAGPGTTAVSGGNVSASLQLPAENVGTMPASRNRPTALVWVFAAMIAAGVVVLVRRLPQRKVA